IVTDVIVAEDMAKFPDLNLAESLQRLPGVAINREGGEGRRVSLRGLGPDFTRVQLNGMEVLGNVDSPMDSRGQTSRDRAFDFNIFASD
ncbi:TonB-dependent receptor plug domain-containing protein, partial [Pseudomonas aeruginosa]